MSRFCMRMEEVGSQRRIGFGIWAFVIPLQLVISIVPWVLHENWNVFLLTLSGTVLALLGSMMPRWAAEKWCCRRHDGCYSITRGNGHRHVFVIKNMNKEGLNLEDLAASHLQMSPTAELISQTLFAILAAFWLVFLICAGALETDIWFLLGVGYVFERIEMRKLSLTGNSFLGMVQNILVARATRNPAAYGFDLQHHDVIEGGKTMQALQGVEDEYPGVGLSLLDIFFPGDLWPKEADYWQEKKIQRHERRLESVMVQPKISQERIETASTARTEGNNDVASAP